MSSRTITFLFRYGTGEHVDFLPALPELCRKLQEKGWDVEHVGFQSHLPPPERLLKVCRVIPLPFRVRRSSRFDKSFKAMLWLALLPWIGWRLQRRGIHTVFVDETLPLTASALRLFYRGRLCFTIHDFFTDIYLSDRWWTRPVGRWLKKRDAKDWTRLDLLFPRVHATKEYLIRKGVEADRIHVVPDSVDTDLFSPGPSHGFRERWGLSAEDIILIHHGILHPNKGNVRLVEALARIFPEVPGLKLVLIGDGSEMPYLQRRVRELEIQDRVVLTGWLPGLRDIADALGEADIGLVMRLGLPGDDFHVTSTLVHNLASGLPVLAVRLKGIEESITEEEEGMLFDNDCGDEFAQKLKLLVGDADLRRRMGRSSRITAEQRFSRTAVADAYAERLG